MKVDLEFKSIPSFYYKEQDGSKPNTCRKIEESDPRDKILSEGYPRYIRIRNAGNPKLSFIRKITDVSYWDGIWIISWKHEILENKASRLEG